MVSLLELPKATTFKIYENIVIFPPIFVTSLLKVQKCSVATILKLTQTHNNIISRTINFGANVFLNQIVTFVPTIPKTVTTV